jgi:Putative peptidoglycan binding domain
MRVKPLLSLAIAGVSLFLAACAPMTRTHTRMEFTPYAPGELRQEKDGITIEIGDRRVENDPSFQLRVFQCNAAGQLIVDANRQPRVVNALINGQGQLWRQVQITNRTRHVLRLNGVVLRLFDPGATQYEPLTFDDIRADLGVRHPCGISPASEASMRAVKIFNRNIEIVPETTSSFWVAFKPATLMVEGVWKFAAYEIPSVVDEAGRPTRTTRFEMRLLAKMTSVTTTQDSPFERPRVVATPLPSATPASNQPAPSPTISGSPTAPPPSTPAPSASTEPARSAPASREVIARAQARLNELGFAAGTADGRMGARTQDAIRKFQASKKLRPTGELDVETLTALGVR